MSFPWRKYLSYIVDVVEARYTSPRHPLLEVIWHHGARRLVTPRAVYSDEKRYVHFRKALAALPWERWNPRQALILGLGMGSIPAIIEKQLRKRIAIVAVEFDPEIIHIATRTLLHDLRNPLEIVEADAYRFIRHNRRRFDLVCMDVFVDEHVPAPFQTAAFVRGLRDALSPGGILLYNLPAFSPTQTKRSRRFFSEVIQPIFPAATLQRYHQNWIVRASLPRR